MATSILNFKAQCIGRLRREFDDLVPAARAMLVFIGGYALQTTGNMVTVTTLGRTDEEQYEIYKNNKDFQVHPWKSFHQLMRAGDLRYLPFSFDEWCDILTVTSLIFKPLGFKALIHPPGDITVFPSGKLGSDILITEAPIPHVHVEIHRDLE